MTSDPDYCRDNAETMDVSVSILLKLEDGISQFTLDEVMEIWDEVVSCEDWDYWQTVKMKRAVKWFFIDNTFCWTRSKQELTNVTYSDGRKPYDYKHSGVFYECKDRAEVREMLFPSVPTSFSLGNI